MLQNMFTIYKLSSLIVGSDVGQFLKLKNIGEVFRRVPLPEDVMLKGLPVLKSSHDAMDWEYLRHHCLNAKEEVSVIMYQGYSEAFTV
jgi:hypothetical protein